MEIRLYPETRALLDEAAARLTQEQGIPVSASSILRLAVRDYLLAQGFKVDKV